jgi:hypothetical protein
VFGLLEQHDDSFYALLDMPEQDSWLYRNAHGKLQPSLICDVFVMATYRHAGVFRADNITFQYTEMTPIDAYSLQLYASEWHKPAACDPSDPPLWCQLNGRFYLPLDGANQVEPYTNQFERCGGSISNNYYRQPHC